MAFAVNLYFRLVFSGDCFGRSSYLSGPSLPFMYLSTVASLHPSGVCQPSLLLWRSFFIGDSVRDVLSGEGGGVSGSATHRRDTGVAVKRAKALGKAMCAVACTAFFVCAPQSQPCPFRAQVFSGFLPLFMNYRLLASLRHFNCPASLGTAPPGERPAGTVLRWLHSSAGLCSAVCMVSIATSARIRHVTSQLHGVSSSSYSSVAVRSS